MTSFLSAPSFIFVGGWLAGFIEAFERHDAILRAVKAGMPGCRKLHMKQDSRD